WERVVLLGGTVGGAARSSCAPARASARSTTPTAGATSRRRVALWLKPTTPASSRGLGRSVAGRKLRRPRRRQPAASSWAAAPPCGLGRRRRTLKLRRSLARRRSEDKPSRRRRRTQK